MSFKALSSVIIILFTLSVGYSQNLAKKYRLFGLAKIDSIVGVQDVEVSVMEYLIFLSEKASTYQYLRRMDRADSVPEDPMVNSKFQNLLPDTNAMAEELKPFFRYLYGVELDSIKVKYTAPVVRDNKHYDYLNKYMFEEFNDVKFGQGPDGKLFRSSIPITGVSYEQALEFCKWKSNKFTNQFKSLKIEFKYRLITPEEYDRLIKLSRHNGYRFIDSVTVQKNEVCCRTFNFHYEESCPKSFKRYITFGNGCPWPVASFFSIHKIYDLYGNVSEMTSVKGIAMGGNYTTSAADCFSGKVQYYTKPEKWLGFRLGCEISEIE